MLETAVPPVTVIVLNWNGRSFLPACLAALQALTYPNFELLIVDNGSTDDSVAWLKKAVPDIPLIETGENLGYAGGNNAALALVKTPFALVVNPDVVLPPDWLTEMMVVMGQDAQIGVAGSRLLYPDEKTVQHLGGFLRQPLAVAADLSREPDFVPETAVYDVEYVIGAALLLRQAMLAEIGTFDDGYFLYYEDTDLCWRAKEAGYRAVVASEITAVHHESATTPDDNLLYLTRFHQSRHRFLLKHWPIETLLHEVYTAEQAWLSEQRPILQRALADVYQATLAILPQMLTQRDDDISVQQQQQLIQSLVQLWRKARQTLPETVPLDYVEIKGQPLVSSTPLLGGVISKIRNAWNGVATKWVVQHWLNQQNEVNQLLVRRINESNWWIAQQEEELLLLLREIGRLQTNVQQITENVKQKQALRKS